MLLRMPVVLNYSSLCNKKSIFLQPLIAASAFSFKPSQQPPQGPFQPLPMTSPKVNSTYFRCSLYVLDYYVVSILFHFCFMTLPHLKVPNSIPITIVASEPFLNKGHTIAIALCSYIHLCSTLMFKAHSEPTQFPKGECIEPTAQ